MNAGPQIHWSMVVSILFAILTAVGLPASLSPEITHFARVLAATGFLLSVVGWIAAKSAWLQRIHETEKGWTALMAYFVVGLIGAAVAVTLYAFTKPTVDIVPSSDETLAPALSGQIDYLFAYTLADSSATAMILQVSVTNQGPPTTVNRKLTFDVSESLAEKGMQILAGGEKRRGWLFFLVPAYLEVDKDVFVPDASLDLSFLDSRGRRYPAIALSGPVRKPPAYYPGTQLPLETPLQPANKTPSAGSSRPKQFRKTRSKR